MIIGVVDLLLLVVTFFCKNYEKLALLCLILLNVIILVIVYSCKQLISSKEYYFKNIDANYMDENLLTKLFEIRLRNENQYIFTSLALIATFTLTIAFNSEAYDYLNGTILYSSFIIIAECIIGIFVFYTFRMDRSTLKELETLFEAKKKLRQLKDSNILSPTQETPTTNEGTNEHENNKAV
ncbi:MAG: hypothetical protein AEth_00040 [Candidatus Argoarchaeum ethanivorans]|uniref:Uncharacterized protein n=1 Tax=Candidatus Argoarchaeum ethanivorans TaxID=2608793 RepID=A0A8B3S752_9EURY|nr:MAG: hypothetical protein AEth_00040 [Candidatus Argoarchaeum ethanivorans]